MNPKGLDIAACDVCSVTAWGDEDSQRRGLYVCDHQSADLMGHISDFLSFILNDPEEIRVHYQHRCGLFREAGFEAVKTHTACFLVVINIGYLHIGLQIGLNDLQNIWVEVPRDEYLFPLRYPCRHSECRAACLASVVVRDVADIKIKEFSHH